MAGPLQKKSYINMTLENKRENEALYKKLPTCPGPKEELKRQTARTHESKKF